MKIFLFSDGGSSHTEKWVNALIQRECRLFLFSLRKFSPAIQNLIDKGVMEGVHMDQFIQSNASAFQKSTYLKVIPFARKMIRQFKPDLVHAHYISSYGLLALFCHPRNYVLSVWGSDVMVFPNRSNIHKWVCKLILRQAKQVWSTSDLMLKIVQSLAPKTPSIQIPFGVDVLSFSPQTIEEKSGLSFGTVKGLAPTYGIDIALKAFLLLESKYPEYPLSFHLFGDGPIRGELEEIAGKSLDKSIVFHGRIPHSEVPNAIRSLDVVVNISRSESFGVTVLEASACEKPVIVSSKGGLPETLIPDTTGIMIPSLDAASCFLAMESLMVASKRKRMGEEGRKFVLKNYDWKKNADLQIAEYARLVNSK
ncbi:MAG: glycosyltransferase involved in cell wall biosynthesis, partial [Luteibaculaceae bacterium]